ncbi:hypothetical protein MNEG_9130 [Monoraphidium neglectum]|uniref:Uncharacterized protein n=1 Tax=Monoraphidium neglectum TaxID=145388 RepID=A0A0D2JHI0_9CHLO|nr:hypothetical protein MNEG_9130 [Monoraphidium neglectum]KIY98832.1 hypothetical protein MNEG_9130 [Monoraphidium neglectum]|eukprot:XP_013897852.1 hypothetical protein MNEG_9130 [Monoraphidium neglectum]
MSSHALANSPAFLAACIAAVAALFGSIAMGPVRVGASLALFTFTSVVLCQYRGCCGATTASTAYFLTRMASVVAGCVWAALVSNLLLPSYTSDWAIDQLATCLERSAVLISDLYNHQFRAMRAAAARSGLICDADTAAAASAAAAAAAAFGPAPAPAGKDAVGAAGAAAEAQQSLEATELALAARLRPEVVAPLLAVQAALEKESVSWRRGPLATPKVARDVLAGLRVLAHAIVAQRITLSPAPTMAPSSLTGHGYFFMGPLHDTWVAVVASVQALAAAAAAQLRRPTDAGGAALAAEIERLEQLRMQLRGAFLAVRRARHSSVRQLSRRFASFGRSFGDLPAVAAAAESAAAAAAAAGGGAEGAAAAARAAEGVDGGLRLEVSDLPGVQDSVQYFAWQFAASRCLNEITAVARLVLWASEKRRRRAAAAAARGGRLARWAGGARELAGRVLASL